MQPESKLPEDLQFCRNGPRTWFCLGKTEPSSLPVFLLVSRKFRLRGGGALSNQIFILGNRHLQRMNVMKNRRLFVFANQVCPFYWPGGRGLFMDNCGRANTHNCGRAGGVFQNWIEYLKLSEVSPPVEGRSVHLDGRIFLSILLFRPSLCPEGL